MFRSILVYIFNPCCARQRIGGDYVDGDVNFDTDCISLLYGSSCTADRYRCSQATQIRVHKHARDMIGTCLRHAIAMHTWIFEVILRVQYTWMIAYVTLYSYQSFPYPGTLCLSLSRAGSD